MFNDQYGLTQAVLEGRKTQTRRIVPQSVIDKYALLEDPTIIDDARYVVGERVAIAQSYEIIYHEQGLETMDMLIYSVKHHKGWTNKMFVKAELMTHHIEITDVDVQRLQDISDEDCIKEGIFSDSGDENYFPTIFFDFNGNTDDGFDTAKEAYAALIDKVSGKGTWESNPFVFCYSFELVD